MKYRILITYHDNTIRARYCVTAALALERIAEAVADSEVAEVLLTVRPV
jgi:hypothetical protein